LPSHCPTMRSAPGSSFGPMAISATTAMTTSSLHPMSNMKDSAHAKPLAPSSIRGGSRLPQWPVSDGLAADVLPRSRGRRAIVIDGLDRLGRLVEGDIVVLHALLESLDAFGNITPPIPNLSAARQQHDDFQYPTPPP